MRNINATVGILVITETWFSELLCGWIEGYGAYHTFTRDKDGGGLSVFVRKTLHSCLVSTLCTDDYESCIVEVSPNKNNSEENIIISGVYRPQVVLWPVFELI